MVVEEQRPNDEAIGNAALAFQKAKAGLHRGQDTGTQTLAKTARPSETKRLSRPLLAVIPLIAITVLTGPMGHVTEVNTETPAYAR